MWSNSSRVKGRSVEGLGRRQTKIHSEEVRCPDDKGAKTVDHEVGGFRKGSVFEELEESRLRKTWHRRMKNEIQEYFIENRSEYINATALGNIGTRPQTTTWTKNWSKPQDSTRYSDYINNANMEVCCEKMGKPPIRGKSLQVSTGD